MKSFKVQPFSQRIYVSQNASQTVTRYNNHAGCDEKTSEEELHGCRGIAFHLAPTGKSLALFLLYLPADWNHSNFADISTLFHEALHLTHFVMDYCSLPLALESTEAQAYLMEHIADMVQRKLN